MIFDQFEEYFFYHPPGPPSDLFESEFARAVNRDDVDANFLIALREDSLHKLDRFRTRIRDLLGNSLRLEQLDRESAERAIKKAFGALQREILHPLFNRRELGKGSSQPDQGGVAGTRLLF